MVDGPGAGYGFDTLARFSIVSPAQLDDDNNAQFYMVWKLSDGRVVRDNTPQITHMSSYADYLRTPVSASADVDYDSLVLVLEAEFGAGPWGGGAGTGIYSDSILVIGVPGGTPVGAGAQVKLVPNGGGGFLQQATTANGWAVFSVDADSFYVYLWNAGYYQQTVPENNFVAAANTKDTVYMVQVTPATPSAPGLTPVSFTFYDGLGTPIKNVILRYNLESKSTTAYHLRDSSIIFDPSRIFEARSASTGTATINVTPNDSILVAGGQVNKTNWRIKAYTPDGLIPLLGVDGVSLAVPASQTGLVYPADFE